MHFVVVDPKGRILVRGFSSPMFAPEVADDEVVHWMPDDRHRIDPSTGAWIALQPFPAAIDKTEILANGTDKAVISGLPRPCVLIVDGVPVLRKAGTLTLTSDMPADYRITANHWPYLPWETTVSAR